MLNLRYDMEIQQKNIWEMSSAFRPLATHVNNTAASLPSFPTESFAGSELFKTCNINVASFSSAGIGELGFANSSASCGIMRNQSSAIKAAGDATDCRTDVLLSGVKDTSGAPDLQREKVLSFVSAGSCLDQLGLSASGDASAVRSETMSDRTSLLADHTYSLFNNWDHLQPPPTRSSLLEFSQKGGQLSSLGCVGMTSPESVNARQGLDDLVSQIVNEDLSPQKTQLQIRSLQSLDLSTSSLDAGAKIWSAERKVGCSYPPGLNASSTTTTAIVQPGRSSTFHVEQQCLASALLPNSNNNDSYFSEQNYPPGAFFNNDRFHENSGRSKVWMNHNNSTGVGGLSQSLSMKSDSLIGSNSTGNSSDFFDISNKGFSFNVLTLSADTMQATPRYLSPNATFPPVKSGLSQPFGALHEDRDCTTTQRGVEPMAGNFMMQNVSRGSSGASVSGGSTVSLENLMLSDHEYLSKLAAAQRISNNSSSSGSDAGTVLSFLVGLGNSEASNQIVRPTVKLGQTSDIQAMYQSQDGYAIIQASQIGRISSGVKPLGESQPTPTMITNKMTNVQSANHTQPCIPVWQTASKPSGTFVPTSRVCFDEASKAGSYITQASINGSLPYFHKVAPPVSNGCMQPSSTFTGSSVTKQAQPASTGYYINGFPYCLLPPGHEQKPEHGIASMESAVFFSDLIDIQRGAQPPPSPQAGPSDMRNYPFWKGAPQNEHGFYPSNGITHCTDGMTAYSIGRLTPVLFNSGGEFIYDSSTSSQFGGSRLISDGRYPRRSNATVELNVRMEMCYNQLRTLEADEKKVEAELNNCHLSGRHVSSVCSTVVPRLPHNPSKVDHLVVESLREHARMTATLSRMKKMSNSSLHSNIYSVMERWMEGIRKVQARRKEEIVSTANRNHSTTARPQDDKDILALAAAISELLTQTRRSRTALWCSLQMTLNALINGTGTLACCASSSSSSSTIQLAFDDK